MAERTIKISHLPHGTTQQDIRKALGDAQISRVHLHQSEAFVELENSEALDVLEFSTEDGKIGALDNATYAVVEPNFIWPAGKEENSEKDDEKNEKQAGFLLSEPNTQFTEEFLIGNNDEQEKAREREEEKQRQLNRQEEQRLKQIEAQRQEQLLRRQQEERKRVESQKRQEEARRLQEQTKMKIEEQARKVKEAIQKEAEEKAEKLKSFVLESEPANTFVNVTENLSQGLRNTDEKIERVKDHLSQFMIGGATRFEKLTGCSSTKGSVTFWAVVLVSTLGWLVI